MTSDDDELFARLASAYTNTVCCALAAQLGTMNPPHLIREAAAATLLARLLALRSDQEEGFDLEEEVARYAAMIRVGVEARRRRDERRGAAN